MNPRMRARALVGGAAALVLLVLLLVVRFPNPDAVLPHRDGPAVRVATYNVWNVMFQWRTRAAYIAEQVRAVERVLRGGRAQRGGASEGGGPRH